MPLKKFFRMSWIARLNARPTAPATASSPVGLTPRMPSTMTTVTTSHVTTRARLTRIWVPASTRARRIALPVQFSARRMPIRATTTTKNAWAWTQPAAISASSAPGVIVRAFARTLRTFGRLLRHEQPRLFAHAQVFAVAIGRVERLVDQPQVPIVTVGNVDHVPPLTLEMREAHQKMQLSRGIGLEVAAGALWKSRQNVAGTRLLGLHAFSSSDVF